MRKILVIILVVVLSLGIWILLGLLWPRPLEPWKIEYEARAEAIDNENVRIRILNKSTPGWGPLLVENLKIFATNENGEMIEVEMKWPEWPYSNRPRCLEEGEAGEGIYLYGRNPRGKVIEVRMVNPIENFFWTEHVKIS